MITPQTNTTLEHIARELSALDSFVICGHVSPDGDCIGSQLALAHALKRLGKEVYCVLANTEAVEDDLQFLPGADDLIAASLFSGQADAFIAVDVPSIDRIGDGYAIQQRCEHTFTIDHHASDSTMSHYNYVDPDIASTSMIVWELCHYFEDTLNKDVALCAYTGLLTDTGGFRYQNSDALAFSAASEMVSFGINPSFVATEVFQSRTSASLKLEARVLERMEVADDLSYALSYLSIKDFEETQATKADADPLINTLRSLKGVRVACMLREQSDCIRGSFRSKDGTNVAILAQKWDGGGHKAAAGFGIYAPLEEAIEQVRAALKSNL